MTNGCNMKCEYCFEDNADERPICMISEDCNCGNLLYVRL